VVEHSLGKGEVESSILSCSTITFPSQNIGLARSDSRSQDRPSGFNEPKRRPFDGEIRRPGITPSGDSATALGSANAIGDFQSVAICVCTCRRPKLLQRCLDSLGAQLVSPDIALEIVIIDNEPEPNNFQAVIDFQAGCCFPVLYRHEPQQGIANARNAAIEVALELGVGWVAMLDDDEAAAPDWIAKLMDPAYRHIAVLEGANRPVYPLPLPYWATPGGEAAGVVETLTSAAAGNVRFDIAIARAGFRFDMAFNLTGGEDRDFFERARMAAFAIQSAPEAITYEVRHPERLTYRGQVHRAWWIASADTRRHIGYFGWKAVAAARSGEIAFNLFNGLVKLAKAPLSRRKFKRRALAGGRALARAIGIAGALIGHRPQPYQTIIGE
jgi:succinoglycan biosynthesis protein ExoM